MVDETKLETIRCSIAALVDEYVGEVLEGLIATEWTIVVGSTMIDWNDGRQSIITIHPGTSYSSRLGLLTSAQHDMLSAELVSFDEDD